LLGILLTLEADSPDRGAIDDTDNRQDLEKSDSLTSVLAALRKVLFMTCHAGSSVLTLL